MPTVNFILICALFLLIGELLPLALLVCCWWVGDLAVRTKVILTALYVGHFGLLLVPGVAPGYGFLYLVAKPVLIALLGGMTFGWEWLMNSSPLGRKC
jgi:hypothetical protein